MMNFKGKQYNFFIRSKFIYLNRFIKVLFNLINFNLLFQKLFFSNLNFQSLNYYYRVLQTNIIYYNYQNQFIYF